MVLKRHGSWIAATVIRFTGAFLAFGLSTYLARWLGIEDFGTYNYLIALVSIGIGFCQFGVINLCVRELSVRAAEQQHGPAHGYYLSLRRLIARLSVVVAMLLLVAYWLGDKTLQVYSAIDMVLAAVSMGIVASTALSQGALRGYGKLVSGLMSDTILRPGLQLVAVLGLALLGGAKAGVTVTLASFFVAAVLTRFVSAWLLHRATKTAWSGFHDEPTLPLERGLVLKSATLGILLAISGSMLVLVAGRVGTSTDVAIVRVALQFALILQIGISLADAACAPMLAVAYKELKLDMARKTLQTSRVRAIVLTLPIIVSYVFFGEWLIESTFGAQYLPAFPVLVIIGTGYFLAACLGSLGTAAFAASLEVPVAIMQAVLIVVTGTAIYFAHSVYGITGTASIYAAYLVLNKVLMQVLLLRYEKAYMSS